MKKVHLFDDDFCTRLLETTGDSDVILKKVLKMRLLKMLFMKILKIQ